MTRMAKLTALLLALAVAGAGTATAAKLITGKQIKNKSLTGKDIRPASLGPGVLNAQAKAALQGPKGEPGTDGATGAAGPTGPSAVFVHRRAEAVTSAQQRTVATQTLPAGTYGVTATLLLRSLEGGKKETCALQTGAAKEIATVALPASAGERISLTIAGGVEIPSGAAGADAQVRVACTVNGDVAETANITIVSTRTAATTVTNE